jgi:hypothetical protein
MTETKITPRIVDNEPVCSGTECPAYCENDARDGGWCRMLLKGRDHMGVEPGATCIPGLRRERDELHRNRIGAYTSEEYYAYKAGYTYGHEHGYNDNDRAKTLGLYPDNQNLRVEWDRGNAHYEANRLLGYKSETLDELLRMELFWLVDPADIIFDLIHQRDERTAERDEARRELCDTILDRWGASPKQVSIAKGWPDLYEEVSK